MLITNVERPLNRHEAVGVLFHPSAVPIIDVFRSMEILEDQYDLALLDHPEATLTNFLNPSLAKGIVSDALLIAFALTRQRARSFDFRPVGSRYGTVEEYCLLTMIAASRQAGQPITKAAASALDIESLDFLTALAGEIARQIDLGTIVFQVPSLSEFRAMVGASEDETDVIAERQFSLTLNFKH